MLHERVPRLYERVPKATTSLDGYTIELTRRSDVHYAFCRELGVHASGPDHMSALDALERQAAERRAFVALSGLDPRMLGRSGPPPAKSGFGIGRVAAILAVGGLVAMQLGYGISWGLSRGLDNTFNASWRKATLSTIEQQLTALADARHDPSDEQLRRLGLAIQGLKRRYAPLFAEFTTNTVSDVR